MKKNILYIVGIVILILLAINLNKDFKRGEKEVLLNEVTTESTNEPSLQKESISTEVKTLSVDQRAWQTVVNYKEAARTHNLSAIKELAYKVSSACVGAETDTSKQSECFSRLDSAYSLLSSLHREDFTTALFDSKQIILISKPRTTEDETKKTVERTLFYFTRDADGNPKILGIDTGRVHTVLKENKTASEVDKMLQEKLLDSDQDSLEDITETCTVSATSACKKTDPNKKDSDGDGYWDSINPLL